VERDAKRIPEGTIEGVLYVPEFLGPHAEVLDWALASVTWDERIRARKTASYGAPYDYAGLTYAELPFPPLLERVRAAVGTRTEQDMNNCLLNYYPDGHSRMGFHTDSEAGIVPGTGVAIVSLGARRPLRFRRIAQLDERLDYVLAPGSLLFMPPRVQTLWQHAIPRTSCREPRVSLTFRSIVR